MIHGSNFKLPSPPVLLGQVNQIRRNATWNNDPKKKWLTAGVAHYGEEKLKRFLL